MGSTVTGSGQADVTPELSEFAPLLAVGALDLGGLKVLAAAGHDPYVRTLADPS